MLTLSDFSFLLVTQAKDLSRVKGVYDSIRSVYPENEIVIVYENNLDTKLNPQDRNLIELHTDHRVYVSKGYNLALKHCTKKCFVFFHDDTFLADGFLENMIPHITENQFCNFTTVEPPLYNNINSDLRPIADFGRSMDAFNLDSFKSFCKDHIKRLKKKVIDSPFGGFFMSGYKASMESVGGFDETFQPFFYEDSDLMVRFYQAGYKFVHALDSLVYHMGSLTTRGTKEGEESEKTTAAIFIKKWKTTWECIREYTLSRGLPYKKISVDIQAINCDPALSWYIDLVSEPGSEIVISFDAKTINQQDFESLQTISYILQSIEDEGEYELGNLKIKYKKNA